MAVDSYLEKLLAEFSVNDIIDYLMEMAYDNTTTPFSPEIIAPAVASILKKRSDQLKP
jgi:hypothetical protein